MAKIFISIFFSSIGNYDGSSLWNLNWDGSKHNIKVKWSYIYVGLNDTKCSRENTLLSD